LHDDVVLVKGITIRTCGNPVLDEATDGCYVLLPELAAVAAAVILVVPLHQLWFTAGDAQLLLWYN